MLDSIIKFLKFLEELPPKSMIAISIFGLLILLIILNLNMSDYFVLIGATIFLFPLCLLIISPIYDYFKDKYDLTRLKKRITILNKKEREYLKFGVDNDKIEQDGKRGNYEITRSLRYKGFLEKKYPIDKYDTIRLWVFEKLKKHSNLLADKD